MVRRRLDPGGGVLLHLTLVPTCLRINAAGLKPCLLMTGMSVNVLRN